jgi:hypothetical protein
MVVSDWAAPPPMVASPEATDRPVTEVRAHGDRAEAVARPLAFDDGLGSPVRRGTIRVLVTSTGISIPSQRSAPGRAGSRP